MEISIEKICKASKLNCWHWNILNNTFEDFGYFGSFSNPEKTFNSFLSKIHSSDREKMRTIFCKHSNNNRFFEKTIRMRVSQKSLKWVFVRGHLSEQTDYKMEGIIMDVHAWKKSQEKNNSLFLEYAHELIQPLMVAKNYASICLQKLTETVVDQDQLILMLQKINHHLLITGNKIHGIRTTMDNQDSLDHQNQLYCDTHE